MFCSSIFHFYRCFEVVLVFTAVLLVLELQGFEESPYEMSTASVWVSSLSCLICYLLSNSSPLPLNTQLIHYISKINSTEKAPFRDSDQPHSGYRTHILLSQLVAGTAIESLNSLCSHHLLLCA